MRRRDWTNLTGPSPRQFICGYSDCGNRISSSQGWFTGSHPQEYVYICPHCTRPTYFGDQGQVPGVAPGNDVAHVPDETAKLYVEARKCVSVGASTAAVLAARKLLMHIAVAQGAKAGESFISYVEFLTSSGYVPPNGKGWVDHIRQKGNEANHEIKLMTADDASELISFCEMLLKFIYEFPNRVPVKQ